jgi:hypothetical protein
MGRNGGCIDQLSQQGSHLSSLRQYGFGCALMSPHDLVEKSWLLGYSVRKDEVSAAPSFSRLFAAKELCLSLLVFGTRRSMCCRTIS